MPDFDFPEFTDWTLYISAPYAEDDKYITCTFFPSNSVQVPTSLTAGIEDIWDKVIGANMHTEPFNFLVSKGLDLVLPTSTVLPKYPGPGSETLLDKYIIDSIHPGGFIPLFVTSGLYPNSFRHERFTIVYIIEDQDTDNFPPVGHEEEAKTINGEDYWLFRPPVSGWMGLTPSEKMIAEDGNIYYSEFIPHYPYKGQVWVNMSFTFAYNEQDASFWGDMTEDWETYSFDWGKPDTPTEYLFTGILMPHYWLDASKQEFWVLGETPEERHIEWQALNTTFNAAFPSEWLDGHVKTMDRFTWYNDYTTDPFNAWRQSINFREHEGPREYPDWWRVWYSAKYYGEATKPGTSLFIRKKGPEVPALLSPLSVLTLIAGTSILGSRFPGLEG